MLQTRKIGAKHYYDYLPDLNHRCGDIWNFLPAQGLLGQPPVSGIVITPACDLANLKTETIVFLPVIPVRSYFRSSGALPDVRSRINGLLQAGKFDPGLEWPSGKFLPPAVEAIESAVGRVQAHLSAKQRGTAEVNALGQALSGFTVLRQIAEGNLGAPAGPELAHLFGRDWEKMKAEIVANSYRADIHFLPKDEQDGGFAGLASHSVVLFRYPITAPVEVLELAQLTPPSLWSAACASLEGIYPAARAFTETQPLKVLSLKSEFLADLLTRYCSVYSRIGSPDFNAHSINQISKEVDL